VKEVDEFERLRDELRNFALERDWGKFHSPKNLAMALSVEVAELVEQFQWQTEEQSSHPSPEVLSAVREEVADVLLYLIRLSDQLGIDLITAADHKIALNARKYPTGKAHGNNKKYTEL
jgi:NTP pyrophosphatase (non-canonical NTP hydrolase)